MSAHTGETASRAAIATQLYAYCRAVDRLDVELGYSVFHRDSLADFGSVYRGSGRGWIDFICQRHLLYEAHSHQVTNILINLDGLEAGSEAYVMACLRSRSGSGMTQVQFWARYVDQWSQRDGRWAIDRRECIVDHASTSAATPHGDFARSKRDRSDPSYQVLPIVPRDT